MFCRIYTDCAIKCFIRTHNRVTCALDNDCLNRFLLVKIDKAQALKLPLKKGTRLACETLIYLRMKFNRHFNRKPFTIVAIIKK